MTEDEARNKWCPFSSTGNSIMCGMNRPELGGNYQGQLSTCKCLASDCACWLWDTLYIEGTATEVLKSAVTTGQCGLIKS